MRGANLLLFIATAFVSFVLIVQSAPVHPVQVTEARLTREGGVELGSHSIKEVANSSALPAVTQNAAGNTEDFPRNETTSSGIKTRKASTASTSSLTKLATIISGCGLAVVLVAGTIFALFITRTAKPLDTTGPIAKKSTAAKNRESSAALSTSKLENGDGNTSRSGTA